EMLAALRDAGWRDYSLFLREDGLLVGYLRTDDFAAALAAMDATDVNARWQAEMAEFFEAGRPDQHMHVLTEVFNLEDQLGDTDDGPRPAHPVPRQAGAPCAAHRDRVLSVRQLGDAVQGVRPGRRTPQPVREDSGRRGRPPLHRRGPHRGPAHPVGQGGRLR